MFKAVGIVNMLINNINQSNIFNIKKKKYGRTTNEEAIHKRQNYIDVNKLTSPNNF